MWRANSLQKTLMLGKIKGRRRRGQQRMRWFTGITDSWTLREAGGQRSLACCGACCHKESGMTQQLKNKMSILVPWPDIKPESLALHGRFLTTGSPGKAPKFMLIPQHKPLFFPIIRNINTVKEYIIVVCLKVSWFKKKKRHYRKGTVKQWTITSEKWVNVNIYFKNWELLHLTLFRIWQRLRLWN